MAGVLGSLLESKSAFLLRRRLKIIPNYRPSSDMAKFRNILKESKSVLILTGAGMSAESGLPTFRGAGGYWRKVDTGLATPEAFNDAPSMVWEFYHYRRELARYAEPNAGHIAIAEFEKRFEKLGRSVTVVTQNIDNLHTRAGSQNVIELHGNVFKTRCTKCKNIEVNNDSPICPALSGRGIPDPDAPKLADIPLDQLPRCKISTCLGLLRPHVIWFGETLESHVIDNAHAALEKCDACLVIGTSSVVYPAAMFAPQAASRGVPVAEFNIEPTLATNEFGFYFEGLCGTTVPQILDF